MKFHVSGKSMECLYHSFIFDLALNQKWNKQQN